MTNPYELAVTEAVQKVPAVIDSAAGEIAAIDALNLIQATGKALEKARKELVDPLNAKVREVNAQFKPLTDQLSAVEANCKRALLSWRDAERKRIADEQARIARENAERERLAREAEAKERARIEVETKAAAEAAGMTADDAKELAALEVADVPAVVPVLQAAPVAPAATVTGSLGQATSRFVWQMRVTDGVAFALWSIDEFRRGGQLCITVDEAAIRRLYMPRGDQEDPQIPGLVFERVEQIAGRRF